MKTVKTKHLKQIIQLSKSKENIIKSPSQNCRREKIKTALSILNIFNFLLVKKARVSTLSSSRAAVNPEPMCFPIQLSRRELGGRAVGGGVDPRQNGNR